MSPPVCRSPSRSERRTNSGNLATAYTGSAHYAYSDATVQMPADTTFINGVGVFSASPQKPWYANVNLTDHAVNAITGNTTFCR